jgi:hypothetical protein
MASSATDYVVEPMNEQIGSCECCGRTSRSLTGLVHDRESTVAAYFVHWTVGHLQDNGADIDIVLGEWGDGTSPADRHAISLLHRESEGEPPALMVIDARAKFHDGELAGHGLRREDVIGTPLAHQLFSIVDAIYLQDGRFF